MLKFKELKKLILDGLRSNETGKKILVKAPVESTDWQIDDFLGNTFQYKIENEWYYDLSTNLPSGELKITGNIQLFKSHKLVEIELK